MLGLYAFRYELEQHAELIADTGFATVRYGGSDWAGVDDQADQMITVTSTQRGYYSSDETFIAAYLGRLGALLAQHKPYAIEISNEPNAQYLWGDTAGATTKGRIAARAVLYAKLLVACYPLIKQLSPSTLVVGMAAAGTSAQAPGFIRQVHAAHPDAANSYDVLSFHPYWVPDPPEQSKVESWGSWSLLPYLGEVRALTSKPIWVTEYGYETTGGKYTRPATRVLDPWLAAAYLVRQTMLLHTVADRSYVMFTTDTDGGNWGIFRDGQQTPAAQALQVFQMLHGDQRGELYYQESSGVYRFTAPGFVARWHPAGPYIHPCPVSRPTDVWSMQGQRLATGVTRTYKTRLSAEPVYFTPTA